MAAYKNPIPSLDDDDDSPKAIDEREFEPEKNEYSFKESVYFAFIDVLGFKKSFDDNRQKDDPQKDGPQRDDPRGDDHKKGDPQKDDPQKDDHKKGDHFAEKYRDVFIYYFDLMNSANFMKTEYCYAGQTSDSLYFYTERADFLIDFLKIFSHLNIYAMTKDVFFRGGIAKGNLYCKEDYRFYGESVIYAYLLESEISKNPIITLDENTYEAIKPIFPDNDKLISEHGGRHYIKPFAYLENQFALDIDQSIKKEINEDLLYKVIKQNKSKFEYDARNYEKYVFLLGEYKAKI